MLDEPHPGPEAARRNRRLQIGMLPLMLLVACCGVLLWVSRTAWENRDLDHYLIQASVRSLQSRDAGERLSAARDLGRLGASAQEVAVPALIAALKDPDGDVRAAAAGGLGQVVSDPVEAGAAVRALTDSLKDGAPSVRTASANALRSLATIYRAAGRPPLDPGTALDVLVGLLGDRDAEVRSAAVGALGPVGQAAGVGPPPPLVALLDHPSADMRGAAALAISDFKQGLDPLIPRLLRLLEQDGSGSKSVYARALSRIVFPPAAPLTTDFTPAILPALAGTLNSRDPEVRCLTLSFLGRLGPRAETLIPALIGVMNEAIDSDPGGVGSRDPSNFAADALGRIAPGTARSDEAITALSDFLRRGHPRRRGFAAYALSRFSQGATVAVPVLIEVLRKTLPSDPSAVDGGMATADALGQIAPGTNRAGAAVEALGAALEARSEYTRLAAIKSLGRFGVGAAPALPRLRELENNDPHSQVRAAAAAAVAELAPAP
jgi:HEAT repeat protein